MTFEYIYVYIYVYMLRPYVKCALFRVCSGIFIMMRLLSRGSQPANGKITRIYFIYDVMFTNEHVLEEEVFVVVL